jgi:DnaK suppressor protein
MPPPTTSAADGRPTAARLIAERARAARQVEARRTELHAIAMVATTEGRDDEHDPDGATVAFEQSMASGLLTQAVAYLSEVDRAIERLAAGVHGACERCGQPIPADRLDAQPTARTCVGCGIVSPGLRKGRP